MSVHSQLAFNDVGAVSSSSPLNYDEMVVNEMNTTARALENWDGHFTNQTIRLLIN